jgi:hypothetical protein
MMLSRCVGHLGTHSTGGSRSRKLSSISGPSNGLPPGYVPVAP